MTRGKVAAKAVVGFVAAGMLAGCATWCRRTPSAAPAETDRAGADRPAADLRPPKPGASFATAGPVLGKREVQPCCCVNGGHYQFLGADVVDEEHHMVVRTVDDPIDGTVVRVFDANDPDRASLVLHRRDCRTLVAEMKPTGSWINGINVLSLRLELDCRTASGDAIAGSFEADECQ